jgi:hypothetical protein
MNREYRTTEDGRKVCYICGCPASEPCRCFAGPLQSTVDDVPPVAELFRRVCTRCGQDLSNTVSVGTRSQHRNNQAICITCFNRDQK